MTDWRGRGLAAVAWGSMGSLARMVLQFAAQIVLARLLGPDQYGLFAIGVLVVSFANFLADSGLAYGLIQKTQVDDRDIRFVWTWQCLLGSAVAALLWIGSDLLATYFGEPRARPLLEVLALVCLLNAVAAPAMNLLKRELDYRGVQVANLVSYVAGFYLVGIPLALAGLGVWALVWAWLVQALVFAVLLMRRRRHALRWLLWHPGAGAQAVYGVKVLATNLLNWALASIDRVVVGRLFSSRDLGLYANAYNLVYAPGAAAAGAIQPVLLAIGAREAGDKPRVASGFRTGVSAVAELALPAFAVVAALAAPVVLTLFGSAWRDAAPLITPLALAMPALMLMAVSTPVLWTQDRHSREFALQLPLVALWLPACLLAARHSTLAVAWTLLALQWLRGLLLAGFAARAVQVGLADVWRCLRGGIALAALSAAFALLAQVGLGQAGAPAPLRMCLGGLVGLMAWMLAVRWQPGLLAGGTRGLLLMVLGRVPAPLAGRLVRWLQLDT